MVHWQRLVKPILRHIGNENRVATSRLASSFSQSQAQIQIQRVWIRTTPLPIYHCFPFLHQLKGISTSTRLLANSSEETPVSSPLAPVSLLGGATKGEQDQKQKAVTKQEKVQAVLKRIKQSPKKLNLVAALVRGMLVKDALMQLQVTIKRAAKTVFKVIHSARANASHNHGLDPDRLIVGNILSRSICWKGNFLKRMSYHAKGRGRIKVRPECRLTVVVREVTPEEEAEIARLRVHNFRKLTKREKRLVPHQLIETTPIWGRKNKSSGQNSSTAAA